MDTVPQTPTALDRTEEVRKLNIIIATVNSQKEILEREVKTLVLSVEDLHLRKVRLEGEIERLERLIIQTVKVSQTISNDCIVAIRGAIEDVGTIKGVLEVLSEKVSKSKDDLTQAKNDQLVSHEQVIAEIAELNRKKADLDVYKRRIEVFYAEHMPDQKVVI